MLKLSIAVATFAAMAVSITTPAAAIWVQKCKSVSSTGVKQNCKNVWIPGQKIIKDRLAEKARQDAMTREMSAEAAAYARMKADRQNAPTKELCYMVNGKLACKPAP